MRHRLLRLLRFLAAFLGLSLGASPGPVGATAPPALFLAAPPSPQPLRPPPRRREAAPVRSGSREASRRRRQIAAGQLGQANGLRPAGG